MLIPLINYPSVVNIWATSSGNGNLAVCSAVPYNISSNLVNLVLSTFVESITKEAVGFNFGTSTGVVVYSQENVIASGLSFTVA